MSTGIAPEAVESLTSRDLGIDSPPIGKDLPFVMREPSVPQRETEGMGRGIRKGNAQRKWYGAPEDRFQQANGGQDVLGPVLEGIERSVRFPSCAVRSVVVAVDGLDHVDESVGVRGTSHDGHHAGARETHSGAAVAKLITAKELGGAEEDDGSVRSQPAARDRVSARRSNRRAWTCLAVTCVGEGPGASRVARSARRTSSSVPRSAKSLAKLVCASRRGVRRRAPGPS